ncbi:helix-turn-helix transcriptional regulator [Kutzneria buriramensis]|uniref:Helix-turn-helix protein n=1 Tax=Kutzneria buriramensis TaxID=1045776 RepID=A0A3E0H2V3_9PSEU|nr:helix-turn-helix transcriptional regulator [Kutzneria buriramensis]REH36302.1 helix-turn-helix protein [Kutzneria buriramensis]
MDDVADCHYQRMDPLPESVWNAREVQDAVAANSPSSVIAFARRAHGLRQDELGALAGFSQSAISRLESGSNLAYDMRVLRIVQRTLGIPAHLLGLAEQGVAPAELRERGGTEALVALLGSGASSGAPATPEIVRELLVARRIINDADNRRVSAALKPAARDLYELTDRLRRSVSGEMRQVLLSVAALYAEFAGWLHEETDDWDGAEHWTARAMQQAQAAEDRDMVAYTYVRMSQLAARDGDHDRVVGLARAAQRERDISPELRVLALQQEARGLAQARAEAACMSRLDDAARLIDRIEHVDTDEYRVGSWTDIEHVEMQRASCLVDLGQPAEAINLYTSLRPRWGHVCPWFQGVHTAKLARAYAHRGDVEQAAAVGMDAVALARVSASPHVVRELRALSPWADTAAFSEVTAQVRALG